MSDGLHPLGRHVEHDERSRAFAVQAVAPLQRVAHRRHGGVLDQGSLGSCTGNATAGALNTTPNYQRGRRLTEADAVAIYELATTLDSVPGSYPPDDTGSSGLAACKAALAKGLIARYEHAFGIDQALAALMDRPVITGVNWYEGFDRPDVHGRVGIAGQVRGGHEFYVYGYQPVRGNAEATVLAANSWGPGWGAHGMFRFTVATWARLLDEQGDVTVPIGVA